MIRAIRGAAGCEENTADEIRRVTGELVSEMLERNGVNHDDLISILFTLTPDLNAEFPAAAARAMGLGDVPLLCASEIGVPHGMPRVVRIMMHTESARTRAELHHVYLGRARSLRDDLPE
ncbi:MAG: chorismate mutase [Acidimicrobiia bacterium]